MEPWRACFHCEAVAEAERQRNTPSIDLRCGDWQTALADVECDALIVDAPYSERTHGGHDSATDDVNRGIDYRARVAKPTGGTGPRRAIGYAAWDLVDVVSFVRHWAPRTRGWFVTITDTQLAPIWSQALEESGRYVFSPLAYVAPGSRVRLAGDGPAQWSCWIVVARPTSLHRWRSLPGAYVLPHGHAGFRSDRLIGGKPLWLMQSLVRDYSDRGDLVCDPCAGGATTLLAAGMENRRAVGAELDPATFEAAQKRLARGFTPALDFGPPGGVLADH